MRYTNCGAAAHPVHGCPHPHSCTRCRDPYMSAFTLLPTNFGAQNSCQHFLISCNVPHTALPCAERAPSLVHMPCAGAPTPALAPGARVRTKTLLVVKLVLTMSLSGFLVDLPRPCPARALLPSLPPLLYIIGRPCRF